MRLFALELRRVLTSRLTCVLLALCLLLTAVLAFLPTTFVYSSVPAGDGSLVTLRGLEAIRHRNDLQSGITGVVTPDKVQRAIEAYQACLNEYGVLNSYELPEGVYETRILPYAPLLHSVKEAFADPDTGVAPSVMALDPGQARDIYAACDARLLSLMRMEQEAHPAAQARAAALYGEVQKPFVFYPQSSGEALDYQTLLAFLILLFSAVIAAPTFSLDYQTGADDIQRCALYGKARLGVTKAAAALCVCAGTYALCAAAYMLLSNTLFGWECVRTSVQMMYSVVSLGNLTMGQLQLVTALGCLAALCATVGLVLLISARSKGTVTSVSVTLLVCLLPLILSLVDLGEWSSWLSCLLPSSCVSLQAGLLYELAGFSFLNLGSHSVWLPHAMLAAAVIEIPVFAVAAVRAYVRRRQG